jgi:oligopeptide/dipeptide ABC transporter ATP-binding protein
MSEILLAGVDVHKHFPVRKGIWRKEVGFVRAVDGVDVFVKKGETLGLVGESGCGKTTLGKCLLALVSLTAGHVLYEVPESTLKEYLALDDGTEGPATPGGERRRREIEARYDLAAKDPEALRRLRARLQIVYQDPFSSLNPRMLIREIIGEPMHVHGVPLRERLERTASLLERVGLQADHMWRYPHEFSGGQRQRICIARALALNPAFAVLDEPTSALDVSVQAQILNLLRRLQREFRVTYLFISHDLHVVRYMANRIAVMYLGKIVEIGSREQLESSPHRHPYTEVLLNAVPVPDPRKRRVDVPVLGDPPSATRPPPGCRFHTRCPYAEERCRVEEPRMEEKEPGHFVACHVR